MVYAASQIPLALLEVIVQSGQATLVGYRAYPVTLPDECLERLDRSRLEVGWRTIGGREPCRRIGEKWYASGRSLGLIVPSAVLPEAYDFGCFNVLVNPAHPEADRLEIGDPIELDIDSRLEKTLKTPRLAGTRKSPKAVRSDPTRKGSGSSRKGGSKKRLQR